MLHPIGWDAFGLPAEQYAIQTGTHPRVTTDKNINRFRQQLQMLGMQLFIQCFQSWLLLASASFTIGLQHVTACHACLSTERLLAWDFDRRHGCRVLV